MNTPLPKIIQGGMGAGVSNWRLAQAVSRIGQLGVVSGTALEQILARRLQEGDPDGHVRRALAHFPFPNMAQRILDALFIPEGKRPEVPFKSLGAQVVEGRRWLQELCVAANFVEVFLAREGHTNPVGINYLEKIQLPHLPSIYGAMLAGVAVVIVGAGIPSEMPGVLDQLAQHQPATYPLRVHGAAAGSHDHTAFDPKDFQEDATHPPLQRPVFLPIVSSDALATMLVRRANGSVDGFVIEGPRAGGHNAPPRGQLKLTPEGEPIYGPRDVVDLEVMRNLGLPFWLAGSYGTAERVRAALADGAAGVQVGTAFALSVESGVAPEFRRALIQKALSGQARVFTDVVASPTGFPFKVAQLEGTLSEAEVYRQRTRVCDLGFLREAYLRDDGAIGYRCASEPVAAYVTKGGKLADTVGRKCLCNALLANIGLAQLTADGGHERALLTLGDDFTDIGRFCTADKPDYTAADVVRVLLSGC
jgi:nitronate monooxygenase